LYKQEELRRQQVQQPLTIEGEEEERRRREEEEQHKRHAQQQQQLQVAPGAPDDGDKSRDKGDSSGNEGRDRKQVGFDDVVKLLKETGDPKKVVEKLREMGVEVEEVSETSKLLNYTYRYGWIVKVGDRYIAITSGHRIGRGDVGDYVAMELPDEGAARNFLVGRYWGTLWGDPEFVKRAAEATWYEKELDRWMREELGRAGYVVERVDWGPNAAFRGFTYIIRDSQGNKIGEVQVARVGGRYVLVNTGLPPAVMASGDPRVAAAYLVYRHMTGDENLAWRLATGDERARELLESKIRYEQELEIRERWFRELSERGLKPIAYSKIDEREVVSEGDLWLDERTGVTYRVVLERQGDRITMKLVPATERDERLLALKSLETEGYRIVDDKTVERDGIRYVVRIEERDGKKVLKLEPYPEDARKAAERELWWELWRQGYERRGEYAVKDGVRYKVEVVEQDGGYVAKLTPVGPAAPDEEPRRYRRGDQRGSLEGMREIQFTIEKLGLERTLRPEDLGEKLRFGPKGRPKGVSYIPVLDEAFYGAFGVPLSQAVFHPAGRELYWRYGAATLPGSRVEGFTLPERQALERAAEIHRQYAEKFSGVWTPLTLRAPKAEDLSWRTAVATAAEAFTFWIPVTKGAVALAAARGLKVPALTVEKTATAGYGARLPGVPGDYFEIHFVEPRRFDKTVRGAFVGQGVGEGAAVRGEPGHLEFVFARSAGQPAPGWAFELAAVSYRDVAEWLKRLPSLAVRTEVRPRIIRFTEVRGFARDLPESPKVELPRVELQPRGREVRVEWRVEETAPKVARETPRAEPESPRRVETPRREPVTKAEEVSRVAVKAAQVGEDLVRPIHAELPVAAPIKLARAIEPHHTSAETSVASVETSKQETLAFGRALEGRAAERLVDAQPRGLWRVYVPEIRRYEFATPALYPAELRIFEPAELERLETRYGMTAETPMHATQTVGRETASRRAADGFAAPPPPRPYVRGGGYGWRETAHVLQRPPKLARRGWRIYELLRI
jgi:hypothetical protein